MKIRIIKAKKENYKEVGFLFNLYRQFYKYKSEIKKSNKYIKERISKKESTIFLCYFDKEPAGFVQLYETFGSLHLGKIIILYDLYVTKEYRKQGIGESLMKKSREFAKTVGAKSIELSTAKNNFTAQSLYEKIGYVKDNEFYFYSYNL